MKLIFVALMAFSGLYAQTVSTVEKTVTKDFRIDSRTTFGNRVYYNCDSVERKAEELLEELGAYNVTVRCRGGIDRWGGWATDARVRTTYTVKASSDQGSDRGSYQSFALRSFGSCHLYTEVFKSVKEDFEFEKLNPARRCFSSNDPVSISGTVLK